MCPIYKTSERKVGHAMHGLHGVMSATFLGNALHDRALYQLCEVLFSSTGSGNMVLQFLELIFVEMAAFAWSQARLTPLTGLPVGSLGCIQPDLEMCR